MAPSSMRCWSCRELSYSFVTPPRHTNRPGLERERGSKHTPASVVGQTRDGERDGASLHGREKEILRGGFFSID